MVSKGGGGSLPEAGIDVGFAHESSKTLVACTVITIYHIRANAINTRRTYTFVKVNLAEDTWGDFNNGVNSGVDNCVDNGLDNGLYIGADNGVDIYRENIIVDEIK